MPSAQLIRSAQDCLVQVRGRTAGSGFLAAPGYVVTCAHVAGVTGSPVELFWHGRQLRGTVLAASPAPTAEGLWPYPDLAIVELQDPPGDHPCAWLHDRIPLGGQQLTSAGHSDKYRYEPEVVTSTFTCQGDQFFDGGLMLRLKQDEVTPGMSGGPVLDPSAGGVCAVVKATRMDSTDMGGLATPVGALRCLDPTAYRALVRAHDTFHAVDPRWPDVPAHQDAPRERATLPPRTQRTLFGLLAAAPAPAPESLLPAFREAAGPYASPPRLPLHEHRDVISELQALMVAERRTLLYAAAVARELSGPPAERLRYWIEMWGASLGLDRHDLAQQLKAPHTLPHSRLRSSGGTPIGVPRSVMIRLRPSTVDPSRYHVAMWRYEGPDAISPADDESEALPLEEALAQARSLLPKQLTMLGGSGGDPVMVELIVPQELMEQDFDEWKPWAGKAWSSLGRKHPVVLRDLERFDDDELHQYWRSRWQRFTAQVTSGGPAMALACDDEADQEMLEGWIESEPSLAALVLAGSLRNPSSGAVLEVALASGVPVILWRRSEAHHCSASAYSGCPHRIPRGCSDSEDAGSCPAEAFFSGLRTDVAVAAPSQWPERVRQLRGKAAAAPAGGHHAKDLVLLWDDPERRLPDAPLRYV
ncbi:trypsin-like peptidase domain-containing protein [Streptomyces fulvoviolaceus]|uniref:VMAP-C domain-containing protein n=1 Tax=Streptomyces fulvoviolaceus TaxID=285535 RepID=UPI0004C48C33|nr:trypsin-like peptidase domain-containing protein [Streptomyces fulvoviolaceus]